MSNKLISEMGLPQSISNIFAARNILTAKDALSMPEIDLMSLLDVDLSVVTSAVARISEIACPPYQTALSLMEDRVGNEAFGGHLSTGLMGLDDALCGGIPFGALTELVGPSGIGKTQFCLKLSLLAALPASHGGLNGRVIYIDAESKFSSRRMIEIGENSFPQMFKSGGMAQKMAGRIVVLRPTSLSEFTESLHQMKLKLLQHEVKLLVVDSMASLLTGLYRKTLASIDDGARYRICIEGFGRLVENESTGSSRQNSVRGPLPFLKSLAEFSRIPIVVTNQVRSQNSDESIHYSFQGQKKYAFRSSERQESHLTAALGIQWAHAVNIRLIFEAHSGQRFIKVAKSPISPPVAFPFIVNSSGISLLSDDGIEIMGQDISTIRCQGQNVLDM